MDNERGALMSALRRGFDCASGGRRGRLSASPASGWQQVAPPIEIFGEQLGVRHIDRFGDRGGNPPNVLSACRLTYGLRSAPKVFGQRGKREPAQPQLVVNPRPPFGGFFGDIGG